MMIYYNGVASDDENEVNDDIVRYQWSRISAAKNIWCMPRLSPRFIRSVAKVDFRLPYLLPECNGDLQQAEQELKWLKAELSSASSVNRACWLRYKRVPLQYILKNQPFGPLTILTKPGVLIPRWETEEWCMDLIARLPNLSTLGPEHESFDVIDLCSGSGCIALAISHERPTLDVYSTDFSSKASRLIGENARQNIPKHSRFHFTQSDVLAQPNQIFEGKKFDLITCNPPYIPAEQFVKECTTSVKLYEPRSALVGDLEFYDNLLNHWIQRTDSFVYEVGDIKQCMHVINGLSHDTNWRSGIKYDSNGQARCVYGFKLKTKKSFDFATMFDGFGQIID